MSACPHCNREIPAFSLNCPHCGAALAAETMREQETLDRLRKLGMGRQLSAGTLLGGPGSEGGAGKTLPEANVDVSKTIPEPRPLAIDGRPTGAQEQTPNPALAYTPVVFKPPRLVPLEEAPNTSSMDDVGEPARLRDESAETIPVPAPRLVSVGEVVEGYLVEQEIGRGGMGRVYKARHQQIDQVVAIKMLLPQFFDDERQAKRFLNEARVLSALRHPNLVSLLGFPTFKRKPFIVMEYVDGETLEKRMRGGRLPIDDAVSIFADLCAGLAAVHAENVLHRDLKPANVLIRHSDGRALLTDFGIARAIGSDRLTLTGMVVGTAEYLAPEQASGVSRDDLRSDVYSAGILLYEMLTGQVPFRHANAAQVLMKQVSAPPPPPSVVAPGLSRAMELAVLKALEKDPRDRYQTVDEMREAVERALHGEAPEPTDSAPPGPRPRASTPRRVQPAEVNLDTRPSPPPKPAKKGMGLITQIVLGCIIGAGVSTVIWYLMNHLK